MILNTPTSPQAKFVEQAGRMLSFWIQETDDLKPKLFKKIDQERHNLHHAVQIGLKLTALHEKTIILLNQTTSFVNQRGYWQEWIPLLEQSVQEQLYQNLSQHIKLLIGLGQSYRLDSQLDKAIEIHLEAKKLAQFVPNQRFLAEVQHELLENYRLTRQFKRAEAAGQSALQLLAKTGENMELVANCHKILGSVFQEQNAYDKSRIYFDKAIKIYRQLDNPIRLAHALNDLAVLYLALKRLDEAEQHLSEAQELLAPTLNELDKCMIWINRGIIHSSRMHWSKAEEAFHRANSPFLRQSPDIPRKARVHNNLGYVLYKGGKHELAEEHLLRALGYWEEISDHIEYANTLSTLADNKLALGHTKEALSLYSELLNKLEPNLAHPFAKKLYVDYKKAYEILIEKEG